MDALQQIKEATSMMQSVLMQQKTLVDQLIEVKSGVGDLRNDMDFLKYETEISTTQCKEVTRKIKKKVLEHLHYPSMEALKYKRVYFHYVYKKLRSDYGLGNSTETTHKRNYENVLKGIDEIFFPDAELRDRADILYEANMQLKSLMSL